MAVVLFTLPLLGAVTAADAIGVLAGIASFLLAPHQKDPVFKQMTSSWADSWPVVFNYARVAGKVIQASDVSKHKKFKKAPSFAQTVCIGFCEGPRNIGRIWADNQVIYDPRPLQDPPPWSADTNYGAGDVVLPTGGGGTQFTASVDGLSGSTEPSWNFAVGAVTNDNEEVWIASAYTPRTQIGQQYGFSLRIYNGNETQLQDSALEALVGVGNQSAYRGLVYIVLEDFDLTRYGNRIPNIEAEILPPPRLPYQFSGDPNWTSGFGRQMMADPDGHFAYFWGGQGTGTPTTWQIVKVDLNNGSVSATSPTISKDTNWPDVIGSPPQPSLTGSKVWYWTFNNTTGNNEVISHDEGTLNIVDTYLFDNAFFPLSQMAINGPGDMGALFDDVKTLLLMNLTSGAYSETDLTTVGLGSTQLFAPTFDNNGKIWFYDAHGTFWRFTVSQSGLLAPVVTAMSGTSFVGRTDDGSAEGTLSFNPDTGIMTAFSKDVGGADLWAVPINVNTNVVSTPVALTDCAVNQQGDGDLFGWHRGRYLALTPLPGGGGNPNYVALYDTQTGTLTSYDWPYWGELNPGAGVEFKSAVSNFAGSAVTSINAAILMSPPDPTYFDTWFFPIHLPGLISLADICADISGRIGLTGSDYDYSALATVFPRGVVLLERMTARQFLESMQPAYFFDLTDIGAQVVGSLRSTSSILLTVPQGDLGASTSDTNIVDDLTIVRNDDLEIAKDLAASYYDYQHDYQQGSTPSIRLPTTQYSSGRNTITVPCVLTPDEASNMVERLLYLMWIERNTYKCSLPLDYVQITPADVIQAVRNNENHVFRVTRATLQPTQIIDIEAVSEDFGAYKLTRPAATADITAGTFTPGTINPIATPALAVLDTAALRPDDLTSPGVYVAGAPSIPNAGWDGMVVNESTDGSVYTQEATVTSQSVMGNVQTVLADWPRHTVFDRTNTVDVTLLFGQLGNASEDALIASEALNAVWFSNGEIIQFATATLLTGTTWRLSDLLRGRFGTETLTGTHGADETFVVLDSTTLQNVTYAASELDATRYWQGMNDAVNPTTAVQTLTMTTRRLMPFAPSFIRGARDISGNLTITGKRRMRWKGRMLWTPPETDTPVTIEVDILSGGSPVRTISINTSGGGSVVTDPLAFSVHYSAADQVTDFGSVQAAISLKAYSLNSLRGRGYPGAKTV